VGAAETVLKQALIMHDLSSIKDFKRGLYLEVVSGVISYNKKFQVTED